MEKSVFDALKWLLLENSLLHALSKKILMLVLLAKKFLLQKNLLLPSLRVLSKNNDKKKNPPCPLLCSPLLYDYPLFFIYGISCFLFLNGYRKCMHVAHFGNFSKMHLCSIW